MNLKTIPPEDAFRFTGVQLPPSLPYYLHAKLLAAIESYASKPSTLVDYHPGSDNKVRDVVHPSLYPYVHGLSEVSSITPTASTDAAQNDDKDGNSSTNKTQDKKQEKDNDEVKQQSSSTSSPRFRGFDKSPHVSHEGENFDFWKRPYATSNVYQWLPSEFEVDNEGKVKIASYINNLPTSETKLYSYLARAFQHVLPSLELSWAYSQQVRYYDDTDSGYGQENQFYFDKMEGSLRNTTLQVITKIVRITLTDEEDDIKGEKDDKDGPHQLLGAWHAEGMSHENIVATASITLRQPENFDATLHFRRLYTQAEGDYLRSSTPQNPPSEIEDFLEGTLVPLGQIDIEDKDIIVFPNSHIHRIDMEKWKKISSTPKPPTSSSRTILVFWLVNPNTPILSTRHIKEQQHHNPHFTLEKAFEHRLKLMEERTVLKQDFNQHHMNLCEH